MIGAFAYSPEVWPPPAAAHLLVALGPYSWRRRRVPAALPLAAGSLFGALWMLGLAGEAASVAPATDDAIPRIAPYLHERRSFHETRMSV